MKCFSAYQDDISEVDGRLDPSVFVAVTNPHYRRLKSAKYPVKHLSELSTIVTKGESPLWRGRRFTEFGIPFLRGKNIKAGHVDFDDIVHIDQTTHENMKRSVLDDDLLLLTMAGTLGDVAYFKKEYPQSNINQDIAKIKLKSEEITYEYASAYFQSEFVQSQIPILSNGGTRGHLNFDKIRSIKVILPPKEKQKKVVEILESAVQSKKQKEAEADRLLNSIDDYVLDEFRIRMPETEDKMCFALDSSETQNTRFDTYYHQPKFHCLINALKNSKHTVSNLGEYITKIHYGASLKNEYVEKGIPFLRILNLKPNYIDLRKVVKLPEDRREEIGNAFVYKGDMLISRSGSVGIVSVVPKEADGFAFGSFMIRFCLNDEINKDFVAIWLNNRFSKIFIQREKIGAIQGNITIETIQNLKIPTPPMKMQDDITKEVKTLMQKADDLKTQAQAELETAKEKVEKMILGKEN